MVTLFRNPQITVDVFKTRYELNISNQFISCADKQLSKSFETITGLRINKRISISWRAEWDFIYTSDSTSELGFSIYVNNNWNDVTVMWKSESGRIYKTHDTDIDCEDIKFWFKELDVLLIHRQLFPGDQLPFKLKGLTYELVVTRINIDCSLEMYFKKERLADADMIIHQIDGFISEYNENSEKKGRKYGIIHNWKTNIEDNKVIYDIDLGSTGPHFFKKLLPYLSGLNCFEKVELC